MTTMTIINLSTRTIENYMGACNYHFNGCDEISNVYCVVNNATAHIKARIPGTSTGRTYEINVTVQTDGRSIISTNCTCPIGHRCKHINKVLYRIRDSYGGTPIPGLTQQQIQQQANHAAQIQRGARVYLAITAKSECDSGSDYNYSRYRRENFDQEILGVFFSLNAANRCAKLYVRDDLGHDEEFDDDMSDEEDDDDDDDNDEYCWDDEEDYCGDENAFTKVWVESRAIEDATAQFHR